MHGQTEQRVVSRARVVLLSGEGVGTGTICERLATTISTISLWPDRYEAEGVAGLPRMLTTVLIAADSLGFLDA